MDGKTRRAPDPFPLFARTGVPEDARALDVNIGPVVDRLIAVLDHAKGLPVSTQHDGLRPEDVRFFAYTLVVYRSRHGLPLTEDHLRLLHAALDIQRPSTAATAVFGMPGIKKLDKFLEAADLQAAAPDISENELAKTVGVGRDTINRWRAMPQFHSRIRAVRIVMGK